MATITTNATTTGDATSAYPLPYSEQLIKNPEVLDADAIVIHPVEVTLDDRGHCRYVMAMNPNHRVQSHDERLTYDSLVDSRTVFFAECVTTPVDPKIDLLQKIVTRDTMVPNHIGDIKTVIENANKDFATRRSAYTAPEQAYITAEKRWREQADKTRSKLCERRKTYTIGAATDAGNTPDVAAAIGEAAKQKLDAELRSEDAAVLTCLPTKENNQTPFCIHPVPLRPAQSMLFNSAKASPSAPASAVSAAGSPLVRPTEFDIQRTQKVIRRAGYIRAMVGHVLAGDDFFQKYAVRVKQSPVVATRETIARKTPSNADKVPLEEQYLILVSYPPKSTLEFDEKKKSVLKVDAIVINPFMYKLLVMASQKDSAIDRLVLFRLPMVTVLGYSIPTDQIMRVNVRDGSQVLKASPDAQIIATARSIESHMLDEIRALPPLTLPKSPLLNKSNAQLPLPAATAAAITASPNTLTVPVTRTAPTHSPAKATAATTTAVAADHKMQIDSNPAPATATATVQRSPAPIPVAAAANVTSAVADHKDSKHSTPTPNPVSEESVKKVTKKRKGQIQEDEEPAAVDDEATQIQTAPSLPPVAKKTKANPPPAAAAVTPVAVATPATPVREVKAVTSQSQESEIDLTGDSPAKSNDSVKPTSVVSATAITTAATAAAAIAPIISQPSQSQPKALQVPVSTTTIVSSSEDAESAAQLALSDSVLAVLQQSQLMSRAWMQAAIGMTKALQGLAEQAEKNDQVLAAAIAQHRRVTAAHQQQQQQQKKKG